MSLNRVVGKSTTRRPTGLVALAGALFLLLMSADGSLAAPRSVFVEIKGEGASAVRERRADVRKRRVKVDHDAIAGADLPEGADTIELNLFADVDLQAQKIHFERGAGRRFSWTGKVADDPFSQVVFVGGAGPTYGSVFAHGKHYSIRGNAAGSQEVVEIDQSAFPPEAGCDKAPTGDQAQSSASPALQDALADTGSSIDVLVVYTPAARSAEGGTAAMTSLIDLAVSETNASYANSGVTPRLNLVHAAEVSYTESGNWDTDLSRLISTNDSQMDGVHTLRDTYHADVVVLMINSGVSYCGLAAAIMADATTAFVLVQFDCASGNYSFGHEIGHLQGARHDRYVDSTNGWTVPANLTYNHGDVDYSSSVHKRTIMAYNNQCADQTPPVYCTRVPYWSSPTVNYPNTSRPTGGATYENNALVLDNTAATVANFRVAYVNHAPSFVKGANQSVLEDAGAQTVSGWATSISAGAAGESSQVLTFTATNDNNTLFSAQPAVAADGTLTYTPAANANGSATVTLTLKDDGGTANGGSDTSAAQSFTITVTVNQAPSFVKGADQSVLEDAGAQTVAGWATSISAGASNESAQVLTFTVTNDKHALFSAQPAIAANGTLTYTPAADRVGSAAVTVTLQDDGGTANGGSNTSAAQSFTIAVTAVNDAPSFVKGANQTVLEDAGAQTVAGWATAISPGPASESGQTLDFIVTNNNNGLFSAQPAVDATGALTYTPAADANGSATVTVRIHDSGGTGNGGADTSAAQTFTIAVTAVNDAPVLGAVGDKTVDEGQLLAFALTATNVDGDSLTYSSTALPTGATLSAATGAFSWTPGYDQAGSYSITFTVTDNGTPSLSDSETITITVIHVIFLPSSWVGSVSITSDRNVVAVARPHIGNEVASYDGFPEGALTAYLPMLFKSAFGGSYNSAFYVQNIHETSTANLTIDYYDNTGALSCSVTDTIAPLASKGYWVPNQTCLPAGWVGGVVITSDQPVVAVGRPHIGTEVMTYGGFSSGSLTSYLPMLFKGAFGGSYDSAFYVQNVDSSSTANLTIDFYDKNGALSCTRSDTVARLASKGYWLPSQSCLPAGWVGAAVVTADQPIVTVGRPHIGSQITTYDGFASGAAASYVPMLFKGAFGGSYDAAFYVQNVSDASTANLTVEYYDSTGALSCTVSDTVAPLASKGTWVPGQSCLSAGWVGGIVVAADQPIVAVGRPHVGEQVTTYNGFTAGSLNFHLPMLFSAAFGGSYNAAFYVQNTETGEASVTIKFYDSTGALTCTRTDAIPALSNLGLWLPSLTCKP